MEKYHLIILCENGRICEPLYECQQSTPNTQCPENLQPVIAKTDVEGLWKAWLIPDHIIISQFYTQEIKEGLIMVNKGYSGSIISLIKDARDYLKKKKANNSLGLSDDKYTNE